MTAADPVRGAGMLRRHSRSAPCPVCGGYAELKQGQGIRCAGFTLERVAYCTREEHAGGLPIEISTSPPAYKHRLLRRCECGREHGWSAIAPPAPALPLPATASTGLPLDQRSAIYRRMLDLLALRPAALDDLTRRGLDSAAAEMFGYRSIPHRGRDHRLLMDALLAEFGEELLRQCPGLTDKNHRLNFWTASPRRDGYVVPYQDENGLITGLQIKVLGGAYRTARGTRLADVYHVAGLAKGADLYLTEGATKGNVAHHLGDIATFSVAGQSLTPGHVERLRELQPARVVVALDQEDNANTERARERWARALWDAGFDVWRAVWDGADVSGPKGIDDLFAAGGRPRLRKEQYLPAAMGEPRRPRPVTETGAIAEGATLAQVRARTARSISSFVTGFRRYRGQSLLVRTAPGSGKTSEMANALGCSNAAGRIVVGTNRLAAEVASEYGYNHIQGRNQDNCQRFDVTEALAVNGHRVSRLACGTASTPRCPARNSCAYWSQFAIGRHRIGSAEQLFNPAFLLGGDLLVADDPDLPRALVERHELTVESLSRALDQLDGTRWRIARTLLEVVQHAAIDVPKSASGWTRPLIGAAVWDQLSRTARRYGEDLVELIDALPLLGALPAPAGDEAGGLTVEDILAVPPATVLRLFQALREERDAFDGGSEFNSRLRMTERGLDIWRVRDHARDRDGRALVRGMALLILDATPVPAFVDALSSQHARLPDVAGSVRLPESVTVVQYAASSNGHAALRDARRWEAIADEIKVERARFPVARPELEAAIAFRSLRTQLEALGFAPEQVLTFGSARGSNALSAVERLHVVGRPMPPGDDLLFLANVLHHNEPAISQEIRVEPRPYGGQAYAADMVDFADSRVSALLHAAREDEILQVVHRARLFLLQSQQSLDLGQQSGRRTVRLVLHTSHPVPGLRVDDLRLVALREGLNERRRSEAEERISVAAVALRERGENVSVSAVARAARAHKRTVAKVLGTPVHTPRSDLLSKGMHHRPQSPEQELPLTPSASFLSGDSPGCAAGCGRVVPAGQSCSECAERAVDEWLRGREERRRVSS